MTTRTSDKTTLDAVTRRTNKYTRPARPLRTEWAGSSQKSDGNWITRSVDADHATKTYRCPGCNQEIKPGTPHIVVWPHTPPIGSTSGVEHRRHWHTGCWNARR
jgi:hypothetical protein